MDKIAVKPFYITGIAIRTTNENGQSATDIRGLWNRFLSENIIARIPDKMDDAIYCVYTDYDGDHTEPYTTLLGCKTFSPDIIPEGLTGKSFPGGSYAIVTAKGKIADGILFHKWKEIWDSNIPRAYIADYELYGSKAQDPDHAEIDIFVGIK